MTSIFATAETDENRRPARSAERELAARLREWADRPAPARGAAPMRQVSDPIAGRLHGIRRNSEFGSLALAWLTFLGLSAAVGGMLQALGPPSASSPPTRAAAATPQPQSIAALLGKVEDAITANPDGAPPGADSAQALQKVAAALPGASPEDRQLAKDTASDLFDRARIALNAGRINEEQRWLALGAILAPPPDLAPIPDNAVQPNGGSKGPGRQDLTPNETEAEAASTPPAQHAEPAAAGSAADPRADQSATGQPVPPTSDDASGQPAPPTSTDANGTATGLAIHVAATSTAAGATAKTLAQRLGAGVVTETAEGSEAPPGAVICYASPDDHSRAKAIGEMLGGMGYYWRLQRSPVTQVSAAPGRIDIWLPPGDSKQRPPAGVSANYCAARQ